jgi:hypothetical protein
MKLKSASTEMKTDYAAFMSDSSDRIAVKLGCSAEEQFRRCLQSTKARGNH